MDQSNNPIAEGEFFRRVFFYRRWKPPGRGVEYEVEQLVLPKQCRKTVLELVHDIPMAGHQERDKTRAADLTEILLAVGISRAFAKVVGI